MSRFISLAIVSVVLGGWLVAAPVPERPAAAIVAGLSDPSAKVRDEASTALQNRLDALPWLRRAARSADKDTARRATALLAPHEPKRQAMAAKAIDACIKSGQVDLFMEWHHYWQPENKDDLWPAGPRMAQAGQDEYAKWCPPEAVKKFLADPESYYKLKQHYHDGPLAQMPRVKPTGSGSLRVRTDRWWKPPSAAYVAFASVVGPAWLDSGDALGRFFVLGPVQALPSATGYLFLACDSEFYNGSSSPGFQGWGRLGPSFVVCRGNFRGGSVGQSVVLVDGDVELFEGPKGECRVVESLIRASGEIRMPNNAKVAFSTVEAHAKNPTAPYKFFELAEVGLSVADDEEGLTVTDVKAETPFGNCGIAKGDLIRAIDDVPAGHSEEFRKALRRALVRQGDCLITVTRGNKPRDLPVFFPLPK